jgi:hypothetical protein
MLFDESLSLETGMASIGSSAHDAAFSPDVKVMGDGRLVVVYEKEQDGLLSVEGRFLDSTTLEAGPPFAVTDDVAGIVAHPRVAVLEGDRLAVTWEGTDPDSGTDTHVMARVFEPDGIAVGDAVRVDLSVGAALGWPQPLAVSNEGFVVVWRRVLPGGVAKQTGVQGIVARMFAAHCDSDSSE